MKRILPPLLLLLHGITVVSAAKVAPDMFGKVCALGDFNGDRNTDMLMFINGTLTINYQETKLLDVLEASKFTPGPSFVAAPINLRDDLIECSVGDFNGDSRLDVLVSLRDPSASLYNHTLYISSLENDKEVFTGRHIAILQQHAMAIDVTNDGLTDILGFFPNGTFFCTRIPSNGGHPLPVVDDCTGRFKDFPEVTKIFPGMPHLFVDIGEDLRAEIIFMTQEPDGSLSMSVWQNTNTYFSYRPGWIPLLSKAQYAFIAAPFVMDVDSDGEMDILVPICREAECLHITQLASWSKRKSWGTVALDLQDYTVIKEPHSNVVFRVGDYSMDSYPDVVVVTDALRPNTRPNFKVLANGPCTNCEKNGTRRFDIMVSEFVHPKYIALGTIQMAAFFDLMEDGELDILVEYELNNQTRLGFLLNTLKADTTFLKVQVFTGVCSDTRCDPKSNEVGSSISWTGACAQFSMTDGWGGSAQSVQCQVPSTGNRMLYLPFLLFGLGRSPNFVDELRIGIPRYADRREDWYHSMKQIVPNSRIIVLPPSDQYPHWQSRLYVTPSSLIIQSLGIIASVCCMLLMVVVFLHYREKKEDRYERQQQSHRFHFDAM